MKKLLLSLAVLSLSGCALVDAYFMAKYDTNEYALINNVKTRAEVAQEHCNNHMMVIADVNDLYFKTLELKNFTTNIPRNKDAVAMSSKLFDITKETREYYNKNEKVSEMYCKIKFQQISKSADTIQNVLGSKPR
jgi:uncharacterized protein YceK